MPLGYHPRFFALEVWRFLAMLLLYYCSLSLCHFNCVQLEWVQNVSYVFLRFYITFVKVVFTTDILCCFKCFWFLYVFLRVFFSSLLKIFWFMFFFLQVQPNYLFLVKLLVQIFFSTFDIISCIIVCICVKIFIYVTE